MWGESDSGEHEGEGQTAQAEGYSVTSASDQSVRDFYNTELSQPMKMLVSLQF